MVESLPFDDATFDSVCSVNTIYFWPSLMRGVEELSRVIKPQGKLVLGFGSAKHLRKAGFAERGFKLYEPAEVEEVVGCSSFRVETVERVERGKRGPFFASRAVRT